MYRQSSEQRSSMETEHQFVNRLFHLPLVATAMDQVNAIYSATKQRNSLMKRTMERAETGVSAVIGTAALPVIFMFDKPLTSFNNFACDQLDKLEVKYPIITKPTDEVVKATKDLCNSAVQPFVDRVSSAKKFGYDKVSDVRFFTGEKLGDVKTYGWTKVGSMVQLGNDQMSRVLTTVVGQHPLLRVEDFLETADGYVDSFLPPEEQEEEEKAEKKEREKEREGENAEEKEDGRASSSSLVVVSKAVQLGSKVQRRLWSRTLKQVKRVQLRSTETLQKLNFTVDLIEFARTNFNETKNKMESIWNEINKTDEEIIAEEETNEEKTKDEKRTRGLESRAIATARQLTLGLKSALSWLHIPHFAAMGAIPEVLTGQIRSLQQKTQSLVDVFSKEMVYGMELTQSALNRTRNLSSQIYSGIIHLVSNLTHFGVEKKELTGEKTSEEEELKSFPTEEDNDDPPSNNIQQEDN